VSRQQPLQVEIVDGRLIVSIGVETLAFAAENGPALEDYNELEGEFIGIRVEDPNLFAADVLRYGLDAEAEDGTTRVHEMLDAAMCEAVEQGAEGIWFPGDDPLEDSE
jgi:hypothetical protein